MKHRLLWNFVTWLVIASPLWWTSGCYSFQQVENWKEYTQNEIRVKTKSGTTYNIERWKLTALGDITAEGLIDNRDNPDAQEDVTAFRGTIRADSIAKIQVWKTNWVLTSVLCIGPAVLIIVGLPLYSAGVI